MWKRPKLADVVRQRYLLLFIGIVVAALAVAVVFFMDGDEVDSEMEETPAIGFERRVFDKVFRVQGRGSFVEIPDHPSLNPGRDGNRDFLVALWFRVAEVAADQRTVLLVKYDRDKSPHSGYAVALNRDDGSNSIRPEIYWQDLEGRGGWLPFPDIVAKAHDWQLLLVSFCDGRYLGVHHGVYSADASGLVGKAAMSSPEVLGGYDLVEIGPPVSSSPLFVGPPHLSGVQARIAVFGIARPEGLTAKLSQVAHQMFAVPRDSVGGVSAALSVLPRADWSLLLDGQLVDHGPFGHVITPRGGRTQKLAKAVLKKNSPRKGGASIDDVP